MEIKPQSLRDFLAARAEVERLKPEIGPTIRLLRQSKGMTQAAAATNAGVSQAYLSQVESGETTPSSGTLERLIEVMDEGSASGEGRDEAQEDV
jgi:transcriptional regulator with XRE-family HTH domain